MSLKLAILASGTGTNAQAMIDKMRAGLLHVEICAVIANRPGAMVLTRAEKAGIPHALVDNTLFPDRASFDRELLKHVLESGAQAVALAGYMRILSPVFLQGFPGPVLNLHPAILPSFPGLHGASDAAAYGVKISGATVHFVDEKMDNGPVIIQAAVPVNAEEDADALQSRIHVLEHRIYPQAIEWLALGRLTTKGRIVHLAPGTARPAAPLHDSFVWPPLEEGF